MNKLNSWKGFISKCLDDLKILYKPLDRPFAATSEEWDRLDKEWKSSRPLRYFVEETIPDYWSSVMRIPFNRAKWWILHRVVPKHQGHILRLELEPGYYDPDTKLLYSAFACLRELMEDPWRNNIDWDYDEEHKAIYKEIKELWHYWTVERPEREERHNNEEMTRDMERIRKTLEEEAEWYEKETEMLTRLVKMRKWLWV